MERDGLKVSVEDSFPPYSYVPGGPWPHPTGSPQGHSYGRGHAPAEPVDGVNWSRSPAYLHGVALFDAGYYWEAHEAWESLWHAHGRRGPTAEVLKGLIKLAAAGVKVRERRPQGVVTHARRAAECFARAREQAGRFQIGLDLDVWIETARATAENPPVDPEPQGTAVSRVFDFRIEPRSALAGGDG